MSLPYKPYKAQKNARKITLYSLAGAIVIVAGIYALRAFLNRDTAPQATASPSVALEPIPQGHGVPLPSAAVAPSQSLAAQQQKTEDREQKTETAPTVPAPQPQVPPSIPVPQTPATAPTSPAVAPASLNSNAAKLVEEANTDLTAGKFIAARDKLNEAVRMLLGSPQQATVKTKLEQLSQMWLYGKDVLGGDTLTSVYTVRPGDSMEIIGKKFKVPYEFLMEINGIAKPEALKVGQKLKAANGPFNVVVSRSTFTMDIYLQTTYVRSFKVGLGKAESETPTGLWRAAIGGKMIKPRWTDPKTGKTYNGDDPDYPLGSRWVALDGIDGNAKGRKGFAIHGTKDPETIGTKSSQGCIRLFNGEAIMVYNMMTPGLSEVRVVD